MQIAEYVRANQRIVVHVASAHIEAELGILLAACEPLQDPAQAVVDLGLDPTPQVKGLVEPARGPGLFDVAVPERISRS